VILRPATAGDARAVGDLEETLFGTDAWSLPTVVSELTGPGRCAVVALEGEALVGYAITLAGAEVVDLQRIAVLPGHRRRGVAAALLDAVRDAAVEAGARRMLLEVSATNTTALAFYERSGFTGIDRRRRYYRDGADALVLARDLP